MSRAERILGRFPNHFEAARPGKLIGDVVTALSRDLNVQSAQIGAVRRSHRVREADTVQDLMRIGVLHGISTGEVDILTMRMVRIALRLAELRAAAAADQEAAIDALLTLWRLELAQDPLDFFAPLMRDGTPDPDPANAVAVILDAAAAASSYASRRRALSRRISDISAIHAQGNGTVRALLYGTANALDLDVSAVFHSEDRYVHAAEARDRIALVPALGSGVAEAVRGTEVFGIEENPRRRAQQDPALRTHAECFEIRRRGFEPAAMEISITPVMDRGIGPMVVNRDEGRGVGYANTVPPGKTLLFSENGRATIDGADVTAFAYGFEGAVFADDDRPTKADAVFDTSPFVVTTPPGSLDRGAIFPHTGPNIAMPSVEVGITHVGFFVQEAHFNLAANPPLRPVDLIVTPRSTVGFFSGPGAPLGSVFAPGADQSRTPSALVSFAWQEREAYTVRILIPARFRTLSDDPEGTDVTSRVTQALERFRPAGIAIETVFIDDRWILGEGALHDDASDETRNDDALLALSGGMVLWPSPDETGSTDPITEQ